jgi:PAS domain S-box-containing protein
MDAPADGIYESVFETIANPALVLDSNCVVRECNRAAAESLGFDDRAHLVGTGVDDLLVDSNVAAELAARVADGDPWVGECQLRRYDDSVVFWAGSVGPVDAETDAARAAGVFTDLTDRRRHARSLTILDRVLRHDLRNDVNVILGDVERVAAHLDGDARQRVQRIRDRLDGILDDADTARELAHLLDRQGRASVEVVRLDHVLADLLTQVDARFPEAVFEVPEHLSRTEVVASDAVYRVVGEVLENAVEHNDADVPRVRVTLATADHEAVLTVADNGPGIPERRRDVVFGREELDQMHHGDGFSLFFVDQAMKAYGGGVRVRSSRRGGAAFDLRFVCPDSHNG